MNKETEVILQRIQNGMIVYQVFLFMTKGILMQNTAGQKTPYLLMTVILLIIDPSKKVMDREGNGRVRGSISRAEYLKNGRARVLRILIFLEKGLYLVRMVR